MFNINGIGLFLNCEYDEFFFIEKEYLWFFDNILFLIVYYNRIYKIIVENEIYSYLFLIKNYFILI